MQESKSCALPLGDSPTYDNAGKRNKKRETRFELATLALARRCSTTEPLAHNGAQNRNRTSDTWIFSPLLYQLSYLGISKNFGKLPETGIEPVRVLPRRILSPVRLPVPPLGQIFHCSSRLYTIPEEQDFVNTFSLSPIIFLKSFSET